MLWLALHLPQLPLQALPWSRPELPVAVVEQHRLIGANRAALRLGIQVGQSAATALSLAPQLLLMPREPARELGCVERLGLALAALTPNLCLADSGVLLDVQASLRLFGGVRRLLRRALALASACGLHARLACAPTAGAAWLLATSGLTCRRALRHDTCARRLDRLPVAALQALLPFSPRQLQLLEALGVRTVRELRALPRAGLQRRLGTALNLALDRAYGDAPDPRRWFVPPERFEVRRELMQRADDASVLCAAVDALLPALRGWLHLHWQAASVLLLRLRHEHGRDPLPDTWLHLRLSLPSCDMAQLSLLWRERLQRHALAAPVYEVSLGLEASVPQVSQPGELLEGTAIGSHEALLDRLAARLGPECVLRMAPLADHRPERAQRAVPASEAAAADTPSAVPDTWLTPGAAPARASSPDAAASLRAAPARPNWLLDPPEPLTATDALGRPLHAGVALRLCSRAERIESGWFDGALARRDYHVAIGSDHRLRWIYHEHGTAGSPHWFLHGWFG